MNFKWSNSFIEKHKEMRRGCEPIFRVPATVKHITLFRLGDGRVGLSGVSIKIQCH